LSIIAVVGCLVMREKKALFATLWLYTFLFWLYIVARIIIDQVRLDDLFLNFVPFFTFIRLGAIVFVFSMIFMYLYLTTN
jgi:hypothetical protein